VANFSLLKTITVELISPQRVHGLNPLLIFMSAIPVKSGTAKVRARRRQPAMATGREIGSHSQ
jgi:hypothetical protein